VACEDTRRTRLLLGLAGVGGVAALLGFVSPDRSRAGWAPLLQPVAHLTPPELGPLGVTPGDAEVPRGGDLEVGITAPERSQVVVRWRAAGDVPKQRTLEVSEGHVSTRLQGIDAPTLYWVMAPDGAVSDTFSIQPVDPLLVSDLVVDVVYPEYLNRDAERFEGEVPPLEVPAGTKLEIRGRATRHLEGVSLVRADGTTQVPLSVTADRFVGSWAPRSSGAYEWRLTEEGGGGAGAHPPPGGGAGVGGRGAGRGAAGGLSRTARQAIGYAEAFAVLDGDLPERDLAATIAARTWTYARRQRSWFRSDPRCQVSDPAEVRARWTG
jgi:hypothetical protein